jgi:hypothetical protein
MRFGLSIILVLFVSTSNAFAEEMDKRQFSMSCKEHIEARSINCDYRHSPKYSLKQISGFINSTEIQLDRNNHKPFPATDESSSVLILLDVSDPRRSATLKGFVIPSVTKFLDQAKSHQRFGLAVFDSDLRVLAPIVNDSAAAKSSLADVKVQGLATELYKSLLKAIDVLEKTDSQRKILIVVSDGKAEDTSYGRKDVIEASKRAGVSVLSIGYAERGSESAYLQTLQRLSSDTYGAYLNGRSEQHAAELIESLNSLEQGGRIRIPAESVFGAPNVQLVFGLADGKELTLSQSVTMTDTRSLPEKFLGSLIQYWYFWLAALTLFVLLAIAFRILYIRKLEASLRSRPYGLLVEMNSKETKYFLKGSATRIGRGRDNDLIFRNDTVSLNHAEIHRSRDGRVLVTDLSSSNGVVLNSERVSEAELTSGDILELGEVRLRYERTES